MQAEQRKLKVGDIIRRIHWGNERVGFVRGICVSAFDSTERNLDISWFDSPDEPSWIGEYWLKKDNTCEVISESR